MSTFARGGGPVRRWNRFTARRELRVIHMKWIFAGFSEKNLRPSNMDSLFVEERRIEEKAALLARVRAKWTPFA